MSGKPSRFGAFLPAETTPELEAVTSPTEAPAAVNSGAYLLRRFQRDEAVARLGNGVRAACKYRLEDYVRELKRDGWPATEARVMEAMFELLDADPEFRASVTTYLTGK